jgi:hypothetical protein
MTELEHKRRIAKNTAALYTRMLVRLLVTLYTSRVVLHVLGFDDFALYGIVGGIVTLFTFIQTALNASTQRFMSVELGRGDQARLSRVFSVSMTLYLLVALFIVLLGQTVGLWFLNTQLVIPPDRLQAANWVFQFTLLTTCVNLIQTPYNASIIAHEKMSFYAWISIADVVLKLGVVFLLTVSPVDKLASYAALLFAVSLVIFFITRAYSRRKFSVCTFRLIWDKSLLQQMAAFSGWTLCDSGAQLAVTQGRVFLLNIFTPLVTNAAMSIATQVSTAVYNIGIQLGRCLFQNREYSCFYFSQGFVQAMGYFLACDRYFNGKGCHQVGTAYQHGFRLFFQIGQSRSYANLDVFCRAFSNFYVVLVAHILLDFLCKHVACHPDTLVADNSPQGNNGDFCGPSAYVHYHIALRCRYVNTNSQGSCHGFVNHIDVTSSCMFRRVPYGTDFDFCASGWDAYYHTQAGHKEFALGVDHFNHTANHLFCRIEICNYPVF